jgi:hypothetical protein
MERAVGGHSRASNDDQIGRVRGRTRVVATLAWLGIAIVIATALLPWVRRHFRPHTQLSGWDVIATDVARRTTATGIHWAYYRSWADEPKKLVVTALPALVLAVLSIVAVCVLLFARTRGAPRRVAATAGWALIVLGAPLVVFSFLNTMAWNGILFESKVAVWGMTLGGILIVTAGSVAVWAELEEQWGL